MKHQPAKKISMHPSLKALHHNAGCPNLSMNHPARRIWANTGRWMGYKLEDNSIFEIR